MSRQDIRLDSPSHAKAEMEEIMECEVCGVVDHHCVRGVCPQCSQKFATWVVSDEPADDAPAQLWTREESRLKPLLRESAG